MKYAVLVFFIGLSQCGFTQEALDFKMTDIHGKEWHLFSELEKGKTVVLDFFFASCKPCQKLTPGMVNLYSDYKEDSSKLIILGISDRDKNSILQEFETNFSSNYFSGGLEGGGDTITELYKGYFFFPGWPVYAVICPNREIHWNLERDSNFVELRGKIDSCANKVSIEEPISTTLNFYPNPIQENLHINFKSSLPKTIQVISLNGAVLHEFYRSEKKFTADLIGLANGFYFLKVIESNTVKTTKFYKYN